MRAVVFRLLLTVSAAFLLCPAASHAQLAPTPVPATRTALLMGVWNYTDDTFPALPEKGIQSDLSRMEAKLTELGFQVTVLNNPSLAEAKKAVDSFGAALKTRGGASLFYFTGHGAEHEGKNFLIPAGTNIQVAADLDDEALSANRVLERMEQSGIRVNLVFLDCCRNSLTKSGSDTGLATMSARGALIGFATRSGDVADADENGSPYTNALIKHLGQPGISLPDMHTLVTLELENSGSTRRPGQYVDLGGIFHLVPAGAASTPPGQLTRAAMPAVPPPASPGSILDQGAVGKVIQVKLPGDVVMKFCYCPPGSFVMGSPINEAERSDDEDLVPVRINKGFWTGQTEVTQGQWKALMGTSLQQQRNMSKSHGQINGSGDDHPIYFVSWEDAQACIKKLNKVIKMPGGWRFSLLTEAQWEYACRAGTESVFHFGNTLTGSQANFDGTNPYGVNTKGDYLEKTTPVGRYGANAWGLQDMHGNVYEWCQDWYGEKLIGGADPQGPDGGTLRVYRGGSWLLYGQFCRSANRSGNVPGTRDHLLGFRVAAVPAESNPETLKRLQEVVALTPREKRIAEERDAWRMAEILQMSGEIPGMGYLVESLKKNKHEQFEDFLLGETPWVPFDSARYQRLLVWLHLDPPENPILRDQIPDLLASLRQDTFVLDLWTNLSYAGSPNLVSIRAAAKKQLIENPLAWSTSQKRTLAELAEVRK